MKLIAVAAVLLCSLSAQAAQAQTVYRCGNAYSQTPCPQATLVEVADSRSPLQQAEGRRVVDQDRRLAAEMRRDRLVDERLTRGGAAATLSGAPAPKRVAVTLQPYQKKRHALDKKLPTTDFVAFDPSSRKRRGGV